MVKRIFLLTLLTLLFISRAEADEGMWLVNQIDKQLAQLMESKGLKLTPQQIYSPGQLGLTDAIVAIDGGSCSGSIISESGLMITNHHCAYGDIHSLSTDSNNYLENGFWAMNQEQEIPIKGKTVTFLRGIVDVTDLTNQIIDSLDAVGPRGLFFMRLVASHIEKRFEANPYEKDLSSYWRGSKYYLYFYETFTDVRLVGAPPAQIGAFGGEQDNWGWPQHKGDFALYRIYADNEPLNTPKHLTISSKGVEENDFVMILGYPGRTNRYSSSFEIEEKFSIINPAVNQVRRAKLDVWKKHMELSEQTRLKYADKYFGVSNYTDYAKWENLCIDRFDIIDRVKERERQLTKWISATAERREKYGKTLENLEKIFDAKAQPERDKAYFQESLVRGSEYLSLGQRFKGITLFMERREVDSVDRSFNKVEEFYKIALDLYKSTDIDADRELLEVMLGYYIDHISSEHYHPTFKALLEKHNGNLNQLVHYAFENSVIINQERLDKFLSRKRTAEEILNDPISQIASTISIIEFNRAISQAEKSLDLSLSSQKRDYTNALYQMEQEMGMSNYPDANSTMRLTYGVVGGLSPRDAVEYQYYSTAKGILEKEDPTDYEFRIGAKLKERLESQEWGRWGQNGELHINFMSDNDITGGNSGSPIMNGNGELVGLAFDGNRESMAGDLYFVEPYTKSVSVDIRYILWVIEQYGEAHHLIKEMRIN